MATMLETPDRVREIIKAVGGMHVLATVDAEGAPRMRWMGALVKDPQKPRTFYLDESREPYCFEL